MLLESLINSNFANQIALSRLSLLQCTLIVTALAGDINQIAMCTPLATATDSLILLVSFWPQDACASVDVLSLFDGLNCIALLD